MGSCSALGKAWGAAQDGRRRAGISERINITK